MEALRDGRRRRLASFFIVASTLAAALLPLAPASPPPADTGGPTWTEESAARGIRFLRAGDDGAGLFKTVVGGGVCVADFDGDGYEDLYLVNQFYYEADLNDRYDPKSRIYRNDGDGTFTDVSEGSGVDARTWGNGCGVGDYDADGDLDLVLTAWGENSLFRNDGGFRFTNVTLAAGVSSIGKCGDHACWSQAAVFGDPDGDGCLDLFVANYVDYDDATAEPGWNGPEHYDGQKDLLFRNRCDGTFEDRSAASGLAGDHGPNGGDGFQGAWVDYDLDGDDDLYVTNDGVANNLWRNDGDGTFTDVAAAAGVVDTRAGMGLDAQDVDGDGWPDLYMTHYQFEQNGFYTNDRDGTFTDRSSEGTLVGSDCCVSWGVAALDYDADGDVDYLVVNGHTREIFDHYAEGRLLYRREGPDLTFTNANLSHGPGMSMISVARGLAAADLDLDGTLDFVVGNTANTTADLLVGSGVANRWLQVDLRQNGPNARGIGARVTVTPDGGAPVERVHRTSQSFLSQHSEREYFGLGQASSATVSVRWPDGATESWTVGADRAVRLTRGDPAPQEDVFSPLTTISVEGAADGGWAHAPAVATLDAEDRGVSLVSGVALTEYRLDGGAWTAYSAPLALAEGDRVIEYRSRDAAGNVEPARRLEVRVDLTPPESASRVEGLVAGWATSDSRAHLDATDSPSGVAAIEHRWDGIDAEWLTYDAPFPPPTVEGDVVLLHRARDVAGNVEATRARVVAVDAIAPRLAHAFDGPHLAVGDATHVTSATGLRVEAADGASGVATLRYRIDEGPWTPYTEPIVFSGPDGARVVSVHAADAAGNERALTLRVVLDNATPPPLAEAEPAARGAYVDARRVDVPLEAMGFAVLAGRVPVHAQAGPDVSGNAWTRVYVDGVLRAEAAGGAVSWEWDSLAEAPGEHLVEFETVDGLGNAGRTPLRVLSVTYRAPAAP